MNKRPKLIDSQGHEEGPARAVQAIECATCHMVRLRGKAWLGPCPGKADRTATPVLGSRAPMLRDGLYRGRAREGT